MFTAFRVICTMDHDLSSFESIGGYLASKLHRLGMTYARDLHIHLVSHKAALLLKCRLIANNSGRSLRPDQHHETSLWKIL
jgi:hypothetical protein